MILSKFYVEDIIKTAINEDINYIDCTSDYLIPEEQEGNAFFVAKASGVVCGIDIAMKVFEMLDDSFSCEIMKHDGDSVQNGDLICTFKGKMRQLLKGERTALNIIQHMSGIATQTNEIVKIVEGTNALVCDTRKTLPGLRVLQKYAVTVGGGRNHRYNLSDAAMLKDNHIDAGGGITNAINKLRSKLGHMTKIEVETRDLVEFEEALNAGADIIMLDNMSCETMAKAVAINKERVKPAFLEASGNVTKETIRAIAETGVDIISIGALTHSVTAFDISMKVK